MDNIKKWFGFKADELSNKLSEYVYQAMERGVATLNSNAYYEIDYADHIFLSISFFEENQVDKDKGEDELIRAEFHLVICYDGLGNMSEEILDSRFFVSKRAVDYLNGAVNKETQEHLKLGLDNFANFIIKKADEILKKGEIK